MLQSGACSKIMEILKIWDLSILETLKITKTIFFENHAGIVKTPKRMKTNQKKKRKSEFFWILIDFRDRCPRHLLKSKKCKNTVQAGYLSQKLGTFMIFNYRAGRSPLCFGECLEMKWIKLYSDIALTAILKFCKFIMLYSNIALTASRTKRDILCHWLNFISILKGISRN